MKLLKNVDDIIAELSKSKIQKQHSFTSTKYNDKVVFKCGCKKTHRVNDPNNKIIGISMPVKFCFLCENSYVVFIEVKGFFNTKATTIWSCKSKLFSDAMSKLGYGDVMKKGTDKVSQTSKEFKKEMKIINRYGAILEKFAGYMVINEKHLPYKKKDIQQAIKMMLVQCLTANQSYDSLITGYSQLGSFQKNKNVSSDDMFDSDPKKYLIKSKKHKKILDKANQEQDKLYKEINLLTKVLKEQIKKKLKSK